MTGTELLIWLIPAALAVVLLAVLSLERLLLLTLFLTPLSIQISYLTGKAGFDLSVPTEPILALLLLVTLFKLIVTREFSVKLLKHPVTVLIGLVSYMDAGDFTDINHCRVSLSRRLPTGCGS